MEVSRLRADEVMDIFRSGDASARRRFISECPSTGFKDSALTAAGMEMPEMRVQALDTLATGYATEGPHEFGAVIAEACHRLGRELVAEHGPGVADTYLLCAGRGALNWANCLQRLGQHQELLEAAEEAIRWLESVDDKHNLNFLRLYRVEGNIDLQNYDEAWRLLQLENEAGLTPFEQVKYRTLLHRLQQLTGRATRLPEESQAKPRDRLRDTLEPLSGEQVAGAEAPELTEEERDALYETADTVTEFLGADAEELNELKIMQMIRNATRIFLDEVRGRDPDAIQASIRDLEVAREWTNQNNFPDHENDALWGLYLCYNRTGRERLAVERLLRLWSNVERARARIADPRERAQIMVRFPYLFPALCVLLHKLDRPSELLAAIEAAKGRVIADILTLRTGRPVDEAAFREAVERLPALMERVGASYLTFLVDEEETFAVLVARDGSIHANVAPVGKDHMRYLATLRDPSKWGRPDPVDPVSTKVPSDLPERLAPLVQWLAPLAEEGLLAAGSHLCYSPDESLHAIPLHYVQFRGEPLVRFCSVSRVHGAHALQSLLEADVARPTQYVAVQVPAVQDGGNEEKIAALEQARRWLAEHSSGTLLAGAEADVDAIARLPLRERIVHFATHGTFPLREVPGRDPSPYRSSGLALSRSGQLPDLNEIASGRGSEALLSPERALDLELDLSGTHMTLQACVSGLAREGVGGEALGLEWAFIQLGASSILSTHWDTSAQTTAEFCTRFYDHWLGEGASRAQAWRDTVLQFMDSESTLSQPYHWAPFSLSGDWR